MSELERLSGIKAFIQSVDSGSFTAAADHLGLTKSAVGKAVAQLEERLGVRLLNRTTRSLGLTDQGRTYYEGCCRALRELSDAEDRLALHSGTPSGRIRIDLPIVFGRHSVTPVLLEIAGRYPKLRLDVSFTNKHTDLLEEDIDLVVRIGHLEDSSELVARRLGVQSMVVCASPKYLRARGEPKSIEDLSLHDCITYNRSTRPNPWIFKDATGGTRSHAVDGHFAFASGDVIADAAIAGFGLAQLPTWLVADDLASGKLQQVLSDHACDGWPIHVVWPRSRQVTPKVRAVVDGLIEHFVPIPPWERRIHSQSDGLTRS
ncbi:LysR family transcriptional regulator [Ottowia thiooxydans]|uniref:LysR family transcriptional regulator n=1 Tax=Ottowia thiooxydans TaxID=219182 RepID=UPI00041C6E26|nr:LysR family transcriptional regulator [Ottowia thiooxydans]